MKNRFCYTLIVLFFVVVQVNAEEKPINFELSVDSAIAPYSDALFEFPAYAALAFENSGTSISFSRPIKIMSANELLIGTERLIFESKKGKKYRYKAIILLPFGKEIAIPVVIDASKLVDGKLSILAYPLGSGLIPQDLITKVESKVQSLANSKAQKNLIDYLAARTKGGLDSSETKSQLFNQIAFDAINRMYLTGRTGRDIGQAESLSDQWHLIIASVVWILGLPIGLYLIRRHRVKSPKP